MTSYEHWSLLISVFEALGTCGATFLSLYFWFNNKKIRITVRISHVDSYGNIKPEKDGYFLVAITNRNPFPITLQAVGLKAYEKKYFISCQKYKAFLLFDNTEFDSLPKKLQYGDSYIFAKPMEEMSNQVISLNDKMTVADLVLVTCVSTVERDLHTTIDAALKSKLLNK